MSQLRASDLKIRRRVEGLLETHPSAPVDILSVAAGLGVEVRIIEIAEDLAGILYQEEARKVIVVNARLPVVRQRVSVARQLGHVAMHQRQGVRVDDGFSVNVTHPVLGSHEDIEDVEANLFALHLLVPNLLFTEAAVGRSFNFADDSEFTRLAGKFQVPVPLIILRLLTL